MCSIYYFWAFFSSLSSKINSHHINIFNRNIFWLSVLLARPQHTMFYFMNIKSPSLICSHRQQYNQLYPYEIRKTHIPLNTTLGVRPILSWIRLLVDIHTPLNKSLYCSTHSTLNTIVGGTHTHPWTRGLVFDPPHLEHDCWWNTHTPLNTSLGVRPILPWTRLLVEHTHPLPRVLAFDLSHLEHVSS